MCTTYYSTKACMTDLEPQSAGKKHAPSKFDQVYSAINQSYSKIYTTINEKLSPKKEDEKVQEEDYNLDTSSSSDELMAIYNLKDLEIGPYYLEKQMNELRDHLSVKDSRELFKKERKWEKIMTQSSGKPIEEFHEDSEFYTEEDFYLKQYAVLHPKTFPRLLQEGPPMQYRWSVWKLLLRPHRFYVKGLYERLRGLPSTSEVQIKKDLHRTFPEEKYFSSETYGKIGQEQLGNVLRAISLYFTNTGYVQGMNFLAGLLLLLSGGDELQSFWMFVALARDPKFMFMGLFEKDFPLLNFYVSIFYQVLEENLPNLYHHIQKKQLPIDLWLMKWFLTIFVPTFPSKDVVRLWDFILRQGFFGMIKLAVAMLKFYEKELMHQDACGMNLMFQSIMEDNLQKEYQDNLNILNTLNPIINMLFRRKDTTNTRPGHVRCSFKEFNVEEVLDYAYEIELGFEDTKEFIGLYEEQAQERLPEPYRKIFSAMSNPHNGVRKFKEFQAEIDYYMMNSGLGDSEGMNSSTGSVLEGRAKNINQREAK